MGEESVTTCLAFTHEITIARAAPRTDHFGRRGRTFLDPIGLMGTIGLMDTIGRQSSQLFAGVSVVGVNGKGVFQADALVFKAVGHSAEPQPSHFVVPVTLDNVQQQAIGFRTLTSPGGCHPLGQQPVNFRLS